MNVLMTLVGSEDCPELGDTKDTKVCGEKKNSLVDADELRPPWDSLQAPLESTNFAAAAFPSASIGTSRQRVMPRQEEVS